MNTPKFITNDQVESVLTWSLVNESVEEALKSVVKRETTGNIPKAHQSPRSKTLIPDGIMFTMPGYVNNHKVTVNGEENKFNTLACKLVTCVQNNEKLDPPMPSILANIVLLDPQTGQLQCVIDGTLITAWRTASASVVSTKYLYFSRSSVNASEGVNLAIIGCGVQGRIHALGMCSAFKVNEIRLWNRTVKKAEDLAVELKSNKKSFVNSDPILKVSLNVEECVADADIIVTATYAKENLLHLKMLKKNVHINAVGAGIVHFEEVSKDIYDVASVYIDHWVGANNELEGLKPRIVCEVGEVIIDGKFPQNGISIFQSLGMAAEDATVSQAVYQHIKNKLNCLSC